MLDNLNLDTGIFLAFLAVNLLVGLYYGRGVRTVQDYALGGRNFSTGALVATLVATAASGSGFFIALSKTYSDGLLYVIASLGMALSYYLIGILLVPRMGEFLGKNSVAEVMGDIYGDNIRMITAISGTIGAAGLIAVQFKAFGTIFNYFLGFSEIFSIVLAGGIVTIYSAFGGVRSVTFTDVLQFITFGVAIPLVGLIIWNQLYSTEGFSIINALEHPKFNYKTALHVGNPNFWQMIPLLLYFAVPSMAPAFCQRIFMGRDIAQVKKAFIITAILFTVLRLSIEWIPFLVFSVNPDLPPNQLLSYIVDHYTYTGLKGLMIVAVTALAMSTADSYINSSSVLFANDICRPFKLKPSNALSLSKVFSFILGIGGIILALKSKDLLDMVLFANSFYMPIVTVPLIMSICGFRSSSLSVLSGMIAGLLTVLTWKYLGIKADGIVFAMLINLIFLFGSHYLLKQPGGWVGIKDTKYLDELSAEKSRNRSKFIQSVKDFTLASFLKKHSPSSELTYTGFGIYCVLYTFTTMYSTQHTLLEEDGHIILTIYQIMLVTGVVMALYPIWPPRIKKEVIVQSWWNLAIFYMLTLFNMFFALLSEFTPLQFMIFTLNSVITITLAGWRFGSVILLVGSYLGFEAYKLYNGSHVVITNIDTSAQAIILYMLFVLSAVVVIFLKPKQEHQELSDEQIDYMRGKLEDQKNELYKALELKYEFIRNLQHEARTPITGITSMAQALDDVYDKISEKKRRQTIRDMAANAERLESYVNNLIDLSDLPSQKYDLKLKKVNLSNLVQEKLDKICKLYIPESMKEIREFRLNIEPDVMSICDEYYMGRTIENIIVNAIQYCKKGMIEIYLHKTPKGINFKVRDEGIGIPPKDLKDIFGAFTTSSKTKTPAGGRGVGLALAKTVIELHNGTINATSDGESWTEITFIL